MAELKKGTKLKLVNMSEVVAAFASADIPSLYLKQDNIYTVVEVKLHKWYIKVKFKEMLGRWFNVSHFEIVKD